MLYHYTYLSFLVIILLASFIYFIYFFDNYFNWLQWVEANGTQWVYCSKNQFNIDCSAVTLQWKKNKLFCYTLQLKYFSWLEENVSRAIGQNSMTPLGEQSSMTRFNDALGKQHLELWTCTWSGCAPWNRGKFVYQSAWCKKSLK